MAWFKLDDQGAFHEKVIAAGNEAYGAWVRAGQWSSGRGTEGFIPRATALTIAPLRVWTRLIAAKGTSENGLVVAVGDDFQIHDFLEWNPTAEEVIAKREARAEAGRRGGRRSGEARRKQTRIKDEANAKQLLQQTGSKHEAKTNPVPVPVPVPREDPPLPPEGESGEPSRVRQIQESKVTLVTGDRSANDEYAADEPASGVHFAIGTAAAEVAKATYEQAVSDMTGEPFLLVDWRRSASAIVAAINGHGKPRTKQEGLSWLRNQVSRWVSENRDRAQFMSGWKPGAFVDWLNAGCPKPKPLAATGTSDPARQPRPMFKNPGLDR